MDIFGQTAADVYGQMHTPGDVVATKEEPLQTRQLVHVGLKSAIKYVRQTD